MSTLLGAAVALRRCFTFAFATAVRALVLWSLSTGLSAAAWVTASPASNSTGNFTVSWTDGAESYKFSIFKDGVLYQDYGRVDTTYQSVSGLPTGSYVFRVAFCDTIGGESADAFSSTEKFSTAEAFSVADMVDTADVVDAAATTSCSAPVDSNTVTVTPQAPGAPGAVLASPTPNTGSFSLSWSAASGSVTHYALSESSNDGASWVVLNANLGTTTTSLTGKLAGSYQYRVQACNNTYCGDYGLIARVEVLPGTPGAPEGAASPNVGNFSLTWTPPAGTISGYALDESLNGGAWSTIDLNVAGASRTLTGKAGGNYRYRVKACTAGGCGAYSAESPSIQVIPASPSGVGVTPNPSTDGTVLVVWNAAAVDYYRLTVTKDGQPFGAGTQVEGTSHTYTALQQGSNKISVQSCDRDNVPICGTAISSDPLIVAVPPPGTPSTSPNPSTGNFTVSWSASTALAANYTLEESAAGGEWVTVASGINGTSQALSGKTVGTYTYRVKACNAAGCSIASTVSATLTVNPPPPGPPGQATASPNPNLGSYTVTWPAATGVVANYALQERLNGGTWTTISPAPTSTSVSFNSKPYGSYNYQVQACNVSGCSTFSAASATLTVNPPIPGVPGAPVASPLPTKGTFTLNWPAASGVVASYTVEESANGGKTWPGQFTGITTTSWSTSDKAVKTWLYRVRACNVTGCSEPSAPLAVRVDPVPPSAPGKPVAAPFSNWGNYSLSWPAATGYVETYQLEEKVEGGTWAPMVGSTTPSTGGGTTPPTAESTTSPRRLLVIAMSDPIIVIPLPDTTSSSEQWSSLTSVITNAGFKVFGKPAGSYRYRVRACNYIGCSAYSAESELVTVLSAPGWKPLGFCDERTGQQLLVCVSSSECVLNSNRVESCTAASGDCGQ